MRRLAAEINDYEIACLQTDIPGFYARLGWEEWRGPLGGRGDDGLIPTPDQRGVMIHRLPRTPTLDLDCAADDRGTADAHLGIGREVPVRR